MMMLRDIEMMPYSTVVVARPESKYILVAVDTSTGGETTSFHLVRIPLGVPIYDKPQDEELFSSPCFSVLCYFSINSG